MCSLLRTICLVHPYQLQILTAIFWNGHVNLGLIYHEKSHNLIHFPDIHCKTFRVLPFLFRKSCSLLLFNSIKWIFVCFILTLFVNSDWHVWGVILIFHDTEVLIFKKISGRNRFMCNGEYWTTTAFHICKLVLC